MALQRRFQTTIDPTQADPAYQPGALKPGLIRRGGVTGTGMREPDFVAPSTPMSGPYTPVTPMPAPDLGGVNAGGSAVGNRTPQSYDTDGYATPGYMTGAGKTMLGGYEPSKLGNIGHQTPKYAVGRIVSNYADTTEGLRQALPDLQRAYPGVQIVGNGGKLDFRNSTAPQLGIVDVGKGFSAGGGQGYQWLVDEPGVAPGAPTMSTGTPIEPPSTRSSILEMLEADERRPLRTAQYRQGREV